VQPGAYPFCQTLADNRPAAFKDRLAKAGHFTSGITEEETPLALIDTSFLGNGKAGFLLTNRALYSSLLQRPLGLMDIQEVPYETPGPNQAWFYILAHVLFGPFFFLFHFYSLLTHEPGHMNQLLVNGKVI
jgi:hypothetical protein